MRKHNSTAKTVITLLTTNLYCRATQKKCINFSAICATKAQKIRAGSHDTLMLAIKHLLELTPMMSHVSQNSQMNQELVPQIIPRFLVISVNLKAIMEKH